MEPPLTLTPVPSRRAWVTLPPTVMVNVIPWPAVIVCDAGEMEQVSGTEGVGVGGASTNILAEHAAFPVGPETEALKVWLEVG